MQELMSSINYPQTGLGQCPIRVLALVIMPNHWHFLLWPDRDSDLTDFYRWLTHTHSVRWHAHYHTSGTGHIYQRRFKSFCIETNEHLYTVARYAERNPLRAGLPCPPWIVPACHVRPYRYSCIKKMVCS